MIEPHMRNGAAFSGMTVGILGGSFNPAHEGHLEMSLHALKKLGLDQVWWLVSPQNPLKPRLGMADFSSRVASAKRLAVHPKIIVTAIEAELGTRFTAQTLRLLMRRFPRTRFVWLMGADNLKQIPKWQKWEKIFHLLPIAVFRRPGYPAGKGMGKAAVRFNDAWLPSHKGGKMSQSKDMHLPAWIVFDNKMNYISATKIRKELLLWPF